MDARGAWSNLYRKVRGHTSTRDVRRAGNPGAVAVLRCGNRWDHACDAGIKLQKGAAPSARLTGRSSSLNPGSSRGHVMALATREDCIGWLRFLAPFGRHQQHRPANTAGACITLPTQETDALPQRYLLSVVACQRRRRAGSCSLSTTSILSRSWGGRKRRNVASETSALQCSRDTIEAHQGFPM
jgi:hypothetical protein